MGTHPIFESDFDCLTENVARGSTECEKIHVAKASRRGMGGHGHKTTQGKKRRGADMAYP